MAASTDKSNPFDPLHVADCMEAWGCLLKAARELRDIDQEMMETMMEADARDAGRPAAGHRCRAPRVREHEAQPRRRRPSAR